MLKNYQTLTGLHFEIYHLEEDDFAQTQRFDMVVLSPTAYEQHSIFAFEPDAFNCLLIHELIHIFEEYLSPNIEAIPNWWSEGLAIYLSEQWLYDEIFRKPALDGIWQNMIPNINEIESDRRLSYEWGWTIISFIKHFYGESMVMKIITDCSDGKVLRILSNDDKDFEHKWNKWVANKFCL